MLSINDAWEGDYTSAAIGLLPFLPRGLAKTGVVIKQGGKSIRLTDDLAGYLKKADNGGRALSHAPVKGLTGQIHHPLSKTVFKALDDHPILKGHYRPRDPRFTTQAIDKAAHNGYQRWHIDLDNQVASWVNSNQAATPAQFEAWLRWRYSQPDLIGRFPNGF